ncbi:hypothetical protein BN1221_04755 [Brenneria goodwinii]|uniref:Uncharacterized protein n=1 Tax=Brenneria goodwinii TaxID=1109412 RepID=A0A0G4K286_9GAMM|nr:hypothetical protein BN1221_04755 [Brenneria goodwinii]
MSYLTKSNETATGQSLNDKKRQSELFISTHGGYLFSLCAP